MSSHVSSVICISFSIKLKAMLKTNSCQIKLNSKPKKKRKKKRKRHKTYETIAEK